MYAYVVNMEWNIESPIFKIIDNKNQSDSFMWRTNVSSDYDFSTEIYSKNIVSAKEIQEN